MARLNFNKQILKRTAIRLFAVLILFVWIGNSLPSFIALANDDSCQMACCRGAAKHSGGSCDGGGCHFKLAKQSDDIICGAESLAKKPLKTSLAATQKPASEILIFDETGGDSKHSSDSNQSPAAQNFRSRESCQNACSASNFQPNGQNRTAKESAALFSFAIKPRPPTVEKIEFSALENIKNFRIISRSAPSRAPPFS